MTLVQDPARQVTIVTPRCLPDLGGVESHVAQVGLRLVEAGAGVEILSTDTQRRLPQRETIDGQSIRRFRVYPRGSSEGFAPGIFWELLRRPRALVHVQGAHTAVPPLAMVAASLRRTPYVVTFHTGGSSSSWRSRIRSTQFRVLAPLLRRAAALVAVCEFEARTFEGWLRLPTGSIPVIRNGGTLPAPSPETTVDRNLVLSVGRLERYKGHHRAIAALAALVKTHPDARLMIVGSGPYESQLRALAAASGVAEKIRFHFVPPTDRQQMADLLGSAGVVALLSDYEAHPVSVMEALSARCPVVVARTSGLTELDDLGWARGVELDADPVTVAQAIAAQLDSPVLPDEALLPTWDTCVSELQELYDTIGPRDAELAKMTATPVAGR